MKILAAGAWLLLAGAQVLVAFWFARPERYRVKISEMAQRLEDGSLGAGLPRWRFVRGAWALWAFLSVVAVFIAPEVAAFVLGADEGGADLGPTAGTELSTAGTLLVVAACTLVVALLVLLLIVMNTGRPRFLVLKPCRGMTPEEIESWLAPRIRLWAWRRDPMP